MTLLIFEMQGYDEYVKDYEEKRKDLNMRPLNEDEILERVKEVCDGVEMSHNEEKTERYVQIMVEGDSIDGQKHYFIFEINMEGYGCVTIRYLDVN